MKRIRLIIWKEFAHIKADPLMLRLIFLPVLVQLFVIGYALTTEVKHTPIAVTDHDNSPRSRELVSHIAQRSELFAFTGYAPSRAALRRRLDDGNIVLGVVIPSDFGSRLGNRDTAEVQVLIDGQDANSSSVAAGYLQGIISNWMFARLDRNLRSTGRSLQQLMPVDVTTNALFNPQLRSSWYMIPGLVVMLVTIVTSLLTGFSIVKERERGTFEQMLVTPIRSTELVIGKAVPFVVIGIAEIAAFLLIATLWFRIPFRGSLPTLFVFSLLYMFSSLGIGILTSTLVRTSQQVLFTIWFILIFFILLGGFFLPIENMPFWVQNVTTVNPVRYFIHVVRTVFLKGAGFAELGREALAMALIGGTVFGLAIVTFHRKAT